MTREKYYTYLGTNGILETPIHLQGVPAIEKICLRAESGKVLTKDGKIFTSSVIVPLEEEKLWREIDSPKGQK